MTTLQTFWTWTLGISVALFCAVELIIVVGGAYDIRAMLRSLRQRGDASPGDTDETGTSPATGLGSCTRLPGSP